VALTKEEHDRINSLFDELISYGESVAIKVNPYGDRVSNGREVGDHVLGLRWSVTSISDFNVFRTRMKTLILHLLSGQLLRERLNDIRTLEKRPDNGVLLQELLGTLRGLKKDFEGGRLDTLSNRIEKDVNFDFMSQAEQLLGGKPVDNAHVPAAVLAGAVLEDALRRLCQRQDPQIKVEFRSKPKKLDRLISDLSNAEVFDNPTAAELRSWAAIRNSAAHGKFKEIDRDKVEQMIRRMKPFLVDYL